MKKVWKFVILHDTNYNLDNKISVIYFIMTKLKMHDKVHFILKYKNLYFKSNES